MKKTVSIIALLSIIVMILVSTCSYAAWYTESYNWARNRGLISSKSSNQMMQNVSTADFYSIFFKYLDLIEATPNKKYVKIEDYKQDNYILVATDRQLTMLAGKDWLTIDEYKKGATLIDNAYNIIEKNEKYFSASEIENVKYYLKMMDYILYTKIYDYNYRLQIYVAKPKDVDKFIEYKFIPYYGEFSREEFLNLLYHYKVSKGDSFSTAQAVKYFVNNKVLLGCDDNLMLTVKLNYAHLVTFLARTEGITVE